MSIDDSVGDVEFDPIKKIASVLSRAKPVTCTGYFHNSPPGSWFMHGQVSLGSIVYSAPILVLLEHIAPGLDRANTKRYVMRDSKATQNKFNLLEVMKAAKSEEDAVLRVCLLQAANAYAFNPHTLHNLKDIVTKEPSEIAEFLSTSLGPKLLIRLYHHKWGLPKSGIITINAREISEVDEPYQRSNTRMLPLDPQRIIAANAFYPFIEDMEGRLAYAKTPLDLCVMVSGKYLCGLILDEGLRQSAWESLMCKQTLTMAFYDVIRYHNLDTIGRLTQ